MTTKVCTKCSVEKPFDAEHFRVKYGKPSGATCRECSRAYGAAYMRENRKRWVPDYHKRKAMKEKLLKEGIIHKTRSILDTEEHEMLKEVLFPRGH